MKNNVCLSTSLARFGVLVAGVAMALAPLGDAGTIRVSPDSPADGPGSAWTNAFHTIQGAVDAATAGDTVLVTNGTYALDSRISVTNAITVESVNGHKVTIVDGMGTDRVFYVSGSAVIDGFTIRNGLATNGYGGGVLCVASGTIANCTVISNTASEGGGGVYLDNGGTVVNSLISGNWALADWGGGIACSSNGSVLSCTVVDNYTIAGGGGISWEEGITVRNTIVYGNGGEVSDNWGGSETNADWTYCCTTPTNDLPGGEGCIDGNPYFKGAAGSDYRLEIESPCRNAGSNEAWMAGATDHHGNPRIIGEQVDMGVHEVPIGEDQSSSPIHYAATNGAAIWPFTNWLTAARTVQEAVSAAAEGDTVFVTNGVYSDGGLPIQGLSNRVAITRAINLQSVNGPDVTSIRGAADPATTNGPAAMRCLYATNGAFIAGFTLTDGHTHVTSTAFYVAGGGGAFLDSGGTLSNCIIDSSSALLGGGLFCHAGGTLKDSTITGNRSSSAGGGVYCGEGGSIENCIISSNSAGGAGGGAAIAGSTVVKHCEVYANHTGTEGGGLYLSLGGRADGCTIRDNTCEDSGGGVFVMFNSFVLYCIITGNSADVDGGGVFSDVGGTIRYGLLHDNSAGNQGGGIYIDFGWVEHCTISSNQANQAGGAYIDGFPFMSHCIIWGNTGVLTNDNWYAPGSIGMPFNCSTPRIPGTGNMTNDPLLVDMAAGNCRLQSGSPCIDAGADESAKAVDLDGGSCPLDGDNDGVVTEDMGCYEYLNSAADSDEDGWTDGDEAAQGTDPAHNDRVAADLGRADVTNHPSSYGLYTSNSIGDLDMGHMMMQVTGGVIDLAIQLQQCTNLTEGVWSNVGSAVEWQHPTEANKMFYRIRGH